MVKLNHENREQYINEIIQAINNEYHELFRELFIELHPTDQEEIITSLNQEQRRFIYRNLEPTEFGEIFQGLNLEQQKQLFNELDQDYAIEMLNDMYSDDVADFLSELTEEAKELYLQSMDYEEAQEVKDLLKYQEQTAGALMTTEFISVSISDRIEDVLNKLRVEGPDAETIYYIYVVDEDSRLVGVVSLRDLLVAPLEQCVEDVMSSRVVSIDVNTDQEEAARIIKKYDFLALPVTDNGRLVGIVTVDDVMDVIEEETEEDFGEISAARGSLDTSISSVVAARRRAPWIIMLMFLGLITASVIGQFEETLEEVILLAVFIPLIMDSAGNTGTQALAVVVRGLALGTVDSSSLFRMLKREFATGIMLGIFCAITLFVIVPIIYGSFWLAFIVGVSLFLTLSISTMVGATVPLIINKLKIDPAVASGPFITTINDILGLLIYFSIATALLQYLPQ
ncbi:magnesium transporter [Desulfitibacter alkalitolerans]|uniref:magnesium transporter n=1 Tax=Desulfitibacter alkalitolerans TaxID=264641 RepID=UPI0004866A58|nr:magnesium transporter [Desulfitibacter alkalitolerans]